MLGTLRSDGFPRISPMEPRFFEDELWISGMPNTTKFNDLARDPRFCLHTATVDTHVGDGDAKLWGVVEDVQTRPCIDGSPRRCTNRPASTSAARSSNTAIAPI